ncbi:MAG: catalase [Solirubrobacterales bacterium]|jgi:catalase|nr:catalase [Solirubrobacterales bacterium]
MPENDLYEQLIEAADGIYGGSRPGKRALHAKGAWAEGTFTASPAAAGLSTAFHFSGEPVAALIRFSNGPGAPDSDDAEREARGFAVKLRGADGEETDILATTTPAFVTRTPEEFLELLRLRAPDPETGQPDFEGLGKFLEAHPEAQTAIQGTVGVGPLASFATAVYYSPHTFYLVDEAGERTPVRYRWIPEAGEQRLDDADAQARGRDYLYDDLAERLAGDGTIAFQLRLQRPADGDPLDDPTALWPDEREFVDAGRLEITELADDPEHDDHIDVFDPMRCTEGVEPSDDKILHARRNAYSVSAYRRWGKPPGPVPDA